MEIIVTFLLNYYFLLVHAKPCTQQLIYIYRLDQKTLSANSFGLTFSTLTTAAAAEWCMALANPGSQALTFLPVRNGHPGHLTSGRPDTNPIQTATAADGEGTYVGQNGSKGSASRYFRVDITGSFFKGTEFTKLELPTCKLLCNVNVCSFFICPQCLVCLQLSAKQALSGYL